MPAITTDCAVLCPKSDANFISNGSHWYMGTSSVLFPNLNNRVAAMDSKTRPVYGFAGLEIGFQRPALFNI